jgi:hypothetical protein
MLAVPATAAVVATCTTAAPVMVAGHGPTDRRSQAYPAHTGRYNFDAWDTRYADGTFIVASGYKQCSARRSNWINTYRYTHTYQILANCYRRYCTNVNNGCNWVLAIRYQHLCSNCSGSW